jgi:hypothetical protein
MLLQFSIITIQNVIFVVLPAVRLQKVCDFPSVSDNS